MDNQEPYAALDNLIVVLGRYEQLVKNRPSLEQAMIRGLGVIDRAVKEGRYAPVN